MEQLDEFQQFLANIMMEQLDEFQQFLANTMMDAAPKTIWEIAIRSERAKNALFSTICDRTCLSDSPDTRKAFNYVIETKT